VHVIIDLCLVPIGVGTSVSREVAECQRVFTERGLAHQMHAYGTNVEGEWDAVFAAVRECHERVHALGAARISSTIKLGTRVDRPQTIADKVASVSRRLDDA
jgi:uncharacterized protein (TIGR00106 family)